MSGMTYLELLAPAKDLACGRAAVDHGADAVYIGGPSFGARAAAGNSLSDIEKLTRYAHQYRSKVYLTLNTILFDNELHEARLLARQAWEAGVDALIIQDLGLLELDLPPLPLIASTQMHNADINHIRFLEQVGFKRIILARELSLKEISEIRQCTAIELESFVHGALCVSFSGRCYMSAALGGRSANRGACGQPCRLPWNLIDSKGRVLEHDKHLLSLKDMNRSDYLADLIARGVNSFKIEGRLKDISYVKNITAFYRNRIDAIIENRTDLKRASSGRSDISFTPDPCKTFYRGAASCFLHGEADDMWSPDTPKSTGELIGTISRCGPNWFALSRGADLINAGDGLCFFDDKKELKGLQVVRVENGRVRVHKMQSDLGNGITIYRNHDHQFLKHLNGRTAVRLIALDLLFQETPEGFALSGCDEDGMQAIITLLNPKEPADNPETALSTLRKQLSKISGSIYYLASLKVESNPYFLRIAQINQLRRDLIFKLADIREKSYVRAIRSATAGSDAIYPVSKLDYSFNVSNKSAREFYLKHGVASIEQAFELQIPSPGTVVMTAKHCLRRCLGACPKQNMKTSYAEPLFLENTGRRFRLEFDCVKCCMHVVID